VELLRAYIAAMIGDDNLAPTEIRKALRAIDDIKIDQLF
jgi:hypothetical protein